MIFLTMGDFTLFLLFVLFLVYHLNYFFSHGDPRGLACHMISCALGCNYRDLNVYARYLNRFRPSEKVPMSSVGGVPAEVAASLLLPASMLFLTSLLLLLSNTGVPAST